MWALELNGRGVWGWGGMLGSVSHDSNLVVGPGDDAQRTTDWLFNQPDPVAALAELYASNARSRDESKDRDANALPDGFLVQDAADHLATLSWRNFHNPQSCAYPVNLPWLQSGRDRSTSEVLRKWLEMVEANLRRSRAPPSTVQRIISRLRSDEHDMVALLQARDLIPGLPEPPNAARSSTSEPQLQVPSIDQLNVGYVVGILPSSEVAKNAELEDSLTEGPRNFLGRLGVVIKIDSESCPPLVQILVDSESESKIALW